MKFRQDKYFKNLTTFRVGGKIKYYIEVKNIDDLAEAAKFARSNNLPIFILGGGSDFVASDKDFNGLVIKYVGDSYHVDGEYITAEAGMKWDDLVKISVEEGLQGLECLSGIPGTVGASPVQNIGAYGSEIADTFYKLEAYDLSNDSIVTFEKENCHFEYRDSIFKRAGFRQKFLILNVTFKLNKNGKSKMSYESLKDILGENDSLKEIREGVLKLRNQKLENPREFGNAGSFFKNPIINLDKKNELIKKYPNIKIYPFENKYKVSAGWLIENAGLKGKELGGAAVSPKHALVLINKTGHATAKDVYDLSEMIIKDVKKKFGINLEREVQLINFDTEKHADKQSSLYDGKKVAVLGLGIEGKDAIKYLLKRNASVTLFDKKQENELDFENIDKSKIQIVCGSGYLKNGITGFDYIVRSPGVYPFIPEITEAKNGGTVITSAIKIFFNECPGKIIGITGTKGKGTTSTLIYEILKADDRDVYLSGNIGKPSLEILPKLTENSWVVLELSSFQLIDMEKSPHVSVVLNITKDHMDWHKNREEYIDAKKNIVRYQSDLDFGIINEGYETPKSFAEITGGKVVFFSKEKLDKKYKERILLRGEHNLENIAAAVATCKTIGVDEKTILNVVRSFKGLEHRLELVAEIDGVKYYNDSFATGPQPTIAAINSFTEDETLILGGSDKGLDYSELRKVIRGKSNVKNLILIGDMGEKIGGNISGKNIISLGHVAMIEIIEAAHKITKRGGVVILSPAAASFDMFKNYKDRGNKFKEAVLSLKH